jgi:hypothetical protein
MKQNEPLSAEAKAWTEKMFPCEPPCDSFGVCEACINRHLFHAGYNFGYRAGKTEKESVK